MPFTAVLQVGLLPAQAPDQPANPYPVAGEAVRVTVFPCGKVAEQVFGHEIPAGELVTVPLPVTVIVSVSSNANVAVALLVAFIVRVHVVAVPEQAPDQPVKAYPLDGAAVRTTPVPYENAVEHVPGQEIPAGELVTVPLPLTPTVSVSGIAVNVAVTLVGLNIVIGQAPVPEQAPDQPVNLYPAPAVAERLTAVP